MSTWPLSALGDLFEIARGGSPRPIDAFITDEPGGINWIMISDASEGSKYITGTKKRIRKEGISRSRMVHPGDFLLTNSMSFGKPYIMQTSGCIHDGWLVLKQRRDNVDADFFYHLLGSRAIYSEFERRAAGATVKNLNIDLVRGVQVILPPLSEQRRIAEVLDKVEDLRSKRRTALTQCDTLNQSIFLEMFGDPVTNPKKWTTAKFGNVCERITVGIVVKPASYYRPSGIPALRSLNIKPGNIILEDLVYFSKEDNEARLAKTRLRVSDLVLVRSGQPGTAAVVPPELDGVNAIDLLIATPFPAKCDPTYLCAFFNSQGGRTIVLSSQRGQVQKHLNVGSLSEAAIPLPPIDLQREFARRLAAVEKLKTAHRAALVELDALFASLQYRAFRGEL
uniref:Restriction endonuclease subunit S n=1 Tax=Geobacter metallireducens TaxID=28232 RepID=A0A831UCC0_GEOME